MVPARLLLVLVALVAAAAVSFGAASERRSQAASTRSVATRPRSAMAIAPGSTVELRAKGFDQPSRIAPPTRRVAQAATINVTYSGFTTEAQAAFQYAVDIWASQVTSTVPIEVEAIFTPLGSGVLGSAGAIWSFRDFPGAPQSGTWYPVPLANKLAGYDVHVDRDIRARFNSSGVPWYYGTDGNPPAGTYDFVSVVLHELGHGLGFAGSATVDSDGYGQVGSDGYPRVYDRLVVNASITPLLSFTSGTLTLGFELTGGGLYWDGTQGKSANGGGRPRLYAPFSWEQGSSYSHLDEDTYPAGNAHSLMTPQLAGAEAIHDPGAITRGMFSDMGWTTTASTATPVPTATPSPVPSATSTAASSATSSPVPSASTTVSPVATSTPTSTLVPVATPVVPLPTGVATVVVTTPVSLPTTVAPPDTTSGGVAVIVPTAVTGSGTSVAVVNPGTTSPFGMTLVVPAPAGTPVGVVVQPKTSLPSGVSVPSGVTVAKVVQIDVFDPATGALIREHASPLELSILLSADEQAICASAPGRIAVLHVDAAGVVSRVAPASLDCSAGIVVVRLSRTSSYALSTLRSPLDIALKAFLPVSLRTQGAGW